jgi:hypothetical protein
MSERVPIEPELPSSYPARCTAREEPRIQERRARRLLAPSDRKVGKTAKLPDEMLDQRRLANSRLAADEHRLTVTRGRMVEEVDQLPQGLGAAREDAEFQWHRPFVRGRGQTAQLADETVSSAPLRFDEARTCPLVAKRCADRHDLAFYDLGLDIDPGPNGMQQVFLADKPPRIVDQEAENVEALRCQIDAIFHAGAISSPQAHIDEVDPK